MKELTGKAKEAFEEYLLNDGQEEHFKLCFGIKNGYGGENWFYRLDESMQWGVLIDFFESVGVYVGVKWNAVIERFNTTVWVDLNEHWEVNSLLQRSEARRAAIEKATQIFNER